MMPTLMSEDELETAKANAEEVDTFDFRNEDDENDFIMAVLLKDRIGHFRLVKMSGFNSMFSGAGNIGHRLKKEEVKNWTRFS
jgi:hypothetical protein